MAQVALDSFARRRAAPIPRSRPRAIDELLARPFFADPLRRHDIAPITDGASAIVLAAGDRARELRENPAWITGFEHRIETPVLGARDLTTSPSTAASAKAATGGDVGSIEVAELYAPFTHQQLILTEAIGLRDVDEGQPVRRRAGRQPDVLDRAWSASALPPDTSSTARRSGCWHTRRAALRCNRIWSPSWKGDERLREEQWQVARTAPRCSAPGRRSTSPSAKTSR